MSSLHTGVIYVVKRAKARSSAKREELLRRTRGFADGIAVLFYPCAEVVVHDLSTQTICYIANNLSRRQIGDASGLDNTEFQSTEEFIGPYAKQNWDGAALRAVSIPVRDKDGVSIGLVCINLDMAVFAQARAALDLFVSGVRLTPQPESLFRDDWQERINTFVHSWLAKHRLGLTMLNRVQKRTLVEDLHANGAFKGKSAVDYVTRVLRMGRATVFKHIKTLRDRKGEQPQSTESDSFRKSIRPVGSCQPASRIKLFKQTNRAHTDE
jgi:D-arginine utilization repressor